jgi:hypothetical protein
MAHHYGSKTNLQVAISLLIIIFVYFSLPTPKSDFLMTFKGHYYDIFKT